MGLDPLNEFGFDPGEVADGGEYQPYRKRGRADYESIVCIEERQFLANDGNQRRKNDRIDLNEGGNDCPVNGCRRPSYLDSWTQCEY